MELAINSDLQEFKTIGEVSIQLDIPQHVLRFWEGQFPQIKPVKRRGGRRFYSQKDVELIERIKVLLYIRGYTIKGAKQALNQNFIPSDEAVMRKKDTRQIDIFEVIGKPDESEKMAIKKVLHELKELQKLLRETQIIK